MFLLTLNQESKPLLYVNCLIVRFVFRQDESQRNFSCMNNYLFGLRNNANSINRNIAKIIIAKETILTINFFILDQNWK